MNKNEITENYSYFLVLIVALALVSHVSYALLGSDESAAWWAVNLATDRIIVISFLFSLFKIINNKLISSVFLVAGIFFCLIMIYEVAYILGLLYVRTIIQYLISIHLIVSLIILCVYAFSCRKLKK